MLPNSFTGNRADPWADSPIDCVNRLTTLSSYCWRVYVWSPDRKLSAVHVNGRRINSCLSFAMMHEEDEITTIEGLGEPGRFHPMQSCFIEHDGYQCGYCTSGQIMSPVALMKESYGTSDTDVKEFLSGNLCRCGAYPNIVAAV